MPSTGQTTVDGISIDIIAPVKAVWEKDSNSRGGKKRLVRKRQVGPAYKLKYKINNKSGEIVPYSKEERRNRIKGTVNPSDSHYQDILKATGQTGKGFGSKNDQVGQGREAIKQRADKNRRQLDQAKQNYIRANFNK
jgi:hypothetical protein